MRDAFRQLGEIGLHLAPQPLVTVLGVRYLHLRVEDGTDLYVTEHGMPIAKCLIPANHWDDETWMRDHSTRLPGTSAVHRVTTKTVDQRSKEIVIKWNRMGQDVPGETQCLANAEAEFNSPFMEFSLVTELRGTLRGAHQPLHTHKPLAIFVPRAYVNAAQLGRDKRKMELIQRSHDEIAIDKNRNYAVIYEWLKGIDAAEAVRRGLLDQPIMTQLLQHATERLADHGFVVGDNKPQHVIVRPTPDGQLVRDRSGRPLFGLVDFELLKRTALREQSLQTQKRRDYLVRQARRFHGSAEFPPGLTPMTVMGVDFVYGQVESTGGALWVVGRDPVLFDYFLPEKWRRTPRTRLSNEYEIYETVTKDKVHLVWRVSRVGRIPDADPFVTGEKRILDHGYNSPFQEFAIALELSRKGVDTTYPRAIYMTGHRSAVSSSLVDHSRYENHASLRTPEGHPILDREHQYVTIWGYWNGPDDALAARDESVYEAMDALAAYRDRRLSRRLYIRVLRGAKRRLASVGMEDLSLRGNHLLLSIDRHQELALDELGLPCVRICNFELLKKNAVHR